MQSNLAMRYIARSFTTFRKDGTLPLIHDINPFSELQYQHQQQHQPKPLPQFKQQICRTPMMNTSIKKLNLLATMIKGKSFMDAFTSLMFLKKDHTAHVLWALQQGAKIARDMQNADPNNLVVAWVALNRGPYVKKVDLKGRGRTGKIRSPSTAMVIMLREKENVKKIPSFMKRANFPDTQRRIINPRFKL